MRSAEVSDLASPLAAPISSATSLLQRDADVVILLSRIKRRYADRVTAELCFPHLRVATRTSLLISIPGSRRRSAPASRKAPLQPSTRSLGGDKGGPAHRNRDAHASGKSFCYNAPVLQSVLTEQAKALYLFPTKALAQDQVAELLEINQASRLGSRAYTFDGDTPDARQAVRTRGGIVVSNLDMMHQAILPHHTKWAQFFEPLRYVVDWLRRGRASALHFSRIDQEIPELARKIAVKLGSTSGPGPRERPIFRYGNATSRNCRMNQAITGFKDLLKRIRASRPPNASWR